MIFFYFFMLLFYLISYSYRDLFFIKFLGLILRVWYQKKKVIFCWCSWFCFLLLVFLFLCLCSCGFLLLDVLFPLYRLCWIYPSVYIDHLKWNTINLCSLMSQHVIKKCLVAYCAFNFVFTYFSDWKFLLSFDSICVITAVFVNFFFHCDGFGVFLYYGPCICWWVLLDGFFLDYCFAIMDGIEITQLFFSSIWNEIWLICVRLRTFS